MYFLKKLWHRLTVKNKYGFIPPRVTKQDWLMGDGNIDGEVIFEDGHGWKDFLPPLEVQNKYFESMSCWVWGTIKCIIAIMTKKFGITEDYSERYISVLGGGTPNGGSPDAGCEAIRKKGLVKQEVLPWTPDLNTFWKFSAPRPMDKAIVALGLTWLRNYKFNHEWVICPPSFWAIIKSKITGVPLGGDKMEKIKEALKYSPLGASVDAWHYKTVNGRRVAYKIKGTQDNHWTVIYDFEDQIVINVCDSYNNCWVDCEWNYDFTWVKKFHVDKTNADELDAEYIKTAYYTKNVKGDNSSGIYFIYDNKKHPYPSMDEYNRICSRYFADDSYITVAQSALDLIPEGNPMILENIKNAEPFNTITESLKQ